ncbi:zinc finger homeobox protein 3-like isoform X1 [Alosa alosa]|nr:zinc finger homeobox protein 3-like isoform X1 [Alosa alosa]XP_048112351.1 zinc finger homeobox protein 3-like isoform X1 [Alosa alosa]XP_048112352.1 zinc finger homeobox protein 3-like isoform X1 [Alosa alosa]XP_048112354.1 zinc finger homeobox protein 3-like isoform X1 [Alosa alosa]XP_048112355.1 zinc finger homeobox protein 3-like isoform X1 [Alosa alosa]
MEFCDSTDHEGSQTQPPWRLPHPGLLLLPKNQPLSLGTLSPLIPSPLLHLQSPTAAAEKGLRRRPTTGGEEEGEEEENGGGAEERRRDEGGVNGMDQGFGGQVGGALGAGSDVDEEDCYDENEMFEEDEEEEEGDVEELVGEIVYRPDGSAFVVENLNQLSQREAEGDNPTPPPTPQPPLTISTCHIAASLAPWFHPPSQNQNQTQIQTLAQPGPTLHSFRVFHLHHQDDGQQPTSNGLPKDDFLTEAADASGGRASGLPGRRPILMCFLCRLSFGCARSFTLHAAREHGVAPSERERRLLALKNASAIIQPVAPGNRPLLSFLEPKIGSGSAPPTAAPCSPHTQTQTPTPAPWPAKDPHTPLGQHQTLPESRRRDGEGDQGTGGERGLFTSDGVIVREEEEEYFEEEEGDEGLLSDLDDDERDLAEAGSRGNGSSGSGSSKGGLREEALANQSDISKSPLLATPAHTQTPTLAPSLSTPAGVAEGTSFTPSAAPHTSFNCLSRAQPVSPADDSGKTGSPASAPRDECANGESANATQPNDGSPDRATASSSSLQHPSHPHNPHHHHHHNQQQHPGLTYTLPRQGTPSAGSPEALQDLGAGGGSSSGGGSMVDFGSGSGSGENGAQSSPYAMGSYLSGSHSRNSCKTLKCPKCNWHYKYQQTLEAHMKEKHPESEGDECPYCSSGQSHPRLARGETYTCGYKPFRCHVCQYSTTTKGNLSIHMQSDKHLHNMQNLQNGGNGSGTEAGHSHGSARDAQGYGNAPTGGGAASAAPCPTQPSALHPPPRAHSQPHAGQVGPQVGGTCSSPSPAKPKGPAMWRCEVCDYETNVARNLRIHMTSEKHTHNMLLLQQNLAQMQQHRTGMRLALGGALGAGGGPASLPPTPSDTDIYQFYLSQARSLNLTLGTKADPMATDAQFLRSIFSAQDVSGLALTRGEPEMEVPASDHHPGTHEPSPGGVDLAAGQSMFQCGVCEQFSCDGLDGLARHLAAQRSLPESEWRTTVGESHHCRLCQYATPLRANFQLHCQTDKHLLRYQLAAHLREGRARRRRGSRGHDNGGEEREDEREKEREVEWWLNSVSVNVGNPVRLRCNACAYDAPSLEKLKLHTMNSQHESSLRLHKYFQQLTGAVDEGCVFYCLLCDYSTSSSLSLVQHSHSLSHQRGEGLWRFQRIQRGLPEEEEELSAIFTVRKPPVPDEGDQSEVEAATDGSAEQEEQTKTSVKGGEKETSRGSGSSDGEWDHNDDSPPPKCPSSRASVTDSPPSLKKPRTEPASTEQMLQCPFCRFSHSDLGVLRGHVMTQHSLQPTLRCPLCRDTLGSVSLLRTHLTHVHNVTSDCTNKLINTVIASDVLPASMFTPVPNPEKEGSNSSTDNTKKLHEDSKADPDKGKSPNSEVPKPHRSPLEDAESTKENTAAYPCWQKGCSKVLKSSTSLQAHISEVHNNQKSPGPVSDRHVYKYRCGQCSLAFKTPEKLQLHSQYHAIRAATMCCLCQRSFRSLQALRKHLETSHLELSEAQLQQLYGGLLMNGDALAMGDPTLGEEQGLFGDDCMKDGDEIDLEEKQSSNGSGGDSGLVQQEDAASEMKRANLPFRKATNLTMEKFLDPQRPFKCTVCKESFTQKNILLVHYNSVSHLHKVKRSLQDSTAGVPESVSSTDHKPFKCSTCNVAYSQSSTLEIHMRSVLHQTKARAAKVDPSISPASANTPSISTSSSSSSFSLSSATAVKFATATSSASSSTAHAHLGGQQSSDALYTTAGQAASHSSLSESHEAKRKRLADIIASTAQQQQQKLLQQQQLAQAQVHLQQELQQKAALLQSHLFNPTLLQHFPMTPEALLPLQQQQQLLFPFYIPGGDFQLSAELKNAALNLANSASLGFASQLGPSPSEASVAQKEKPSISTSQQDLTRPPLQQTPTVSHAISNVISHQDGGKAQTPKIHTETAVPEQHRKEEAESTNIRPTEKQDAGKCNTGESQEAKSSGKEVKVGFLPPRISHDASDNASRALLENIGFELVMQFNESKQRVQRKFSENIAMAVGESDSKEVDPLQGKLKCVACHKLFSNTLILKSHQEHVHQTVFPIESLEKFAKDYRDQYDKQYPLRSLTPESSPTPPPPPPPPPPKPPTPPSSQPSQQPPTPSSAPSTPTVAPPTVSAPLPKAPTLPPPPPLSLPVDLPLFPPLMMQPIPLKTLPPPVPGSMPAMDVGLTHDLAQLYQQQLSPALLQQQGKRPRTRITDEQLSVLRQYFDINNSPNEDQIKEMADKSGLPQKVIKHWFRNTLFKERQRNKDSPYNFNNPPTTTLEDAKVDSRPPSPEPQRYECYGSKRSSRTRFTDYQLRVLQDFFDANAYPKDDEFEQLSNLLGLPTRVIVVWFQNARQKARKNYENQGEGAKESSERREMSNDRYIRTPNLSYQCKKCSLVFQRIFDLIKHQKKMCYKDEEDDTRYDSHEDSNDFRNEYYSSSASSTSHTPTLSCSSSTLTAESTSTHNVKPADSNDASAASISETPRERSSHTAEAPNLSKPHQSSSATLHQKEPQLETHHHKLLAEEKEKGHASSPKPSSSMKQQQQQLSPSVPQTSPASSESTRTSLNTVSSPQTSQQTRLTQPVTPFHCGQCKLGFPSFESWQEHQQLHLLANQNQFVHPQFLDRPTDMPFMLFDPSNTLLASQLLSSAFPQIPSSSISSSPMPSATINSLKRKLEEKASTSPMENDWENNGDEQHRDKRMRTTITPEQLEVLYQKYLLDSNPTRKMLDQISNEVGLKKRVVQVWFQNTRARERKGQFRALGPAQAHRRCPFCRALFKAQTALDAHIRSRHWHEAKSVGYSFSMSGMLSDQVGMKMDGPEMSGNLQLSSSWSSQLAALSPANKSTDSSHHHSSSPRFKMEGSDDFDGPSSSSLSQSYDLSKFDNDDCSSVNTSITDATMGEEGGDTSESKHRGSDILAQMTDRAFSCDNDDLMSSDLVSPAMSFNAKDYDNEMMVDYSESSSLADPSSPCPGTSGSQSGDNIERSGPKRYRTQLSNLQVKVLKACFTDYKTPTMLECEALGNHIGLAKRVVQVWFQNARAKEKKAKLNLAKQFGGEPSQSEAPKTECTLCAVKYNSCLSVRDHVFSQAHVAKVKEAVGSQMDKERDYFDPSTVRQLMAQQEMDHLKKSNEVLGMAPHQRFDPATLQALNLSSMYPGLQNMPGVCSASSLNSPHIAGPSSLSPSVSSSGLPTKPTTTSSSSSTPSNSKVSMATSASTAKTKQPELQPERPKENGTEKSEKEKVKEKPSIPPAPSTSSTPRKSDKQDPSAPTTSTPKPGMEFVMDPAQLQALQAARGGADPAAFLSNPFLPCFMPGFPSYFPPQIPGALPGGYLQPIYGMEGLFPYGPAALSQALMGLSQGSILQQYQQYQQSLQGALQQKHLQLQQQQTQKPKAHSQAKADSKQPSQDTVKARERKDPSCGKASPSTSSDQLSSPLGNKPSKVRNMDEHLLLREGVVPKVKGGEQGKGGRLYDCLACDVTLNADDGEALCRHLESPQHKRSAAERLNAKEHATHVLPHTATCAPDSAMASTSQPAPLSTLTPPSSSSSSSSHPSTIDGLCSPPNLSTALSGSPDTTRTLASFCNQTPSSPSTVTSSLARPSSARSSMPTDPNGGTPRAPAMEKPLERQSPTLPEEDPLGGNSRQDGSGNANGNGSDFTCVGTDSLGM